MSLVDRSLFDKNSYATLAEMRKQSAPAFPKTQYCRETNSMYVWGAARNDTADGRDIVQSSEQKYQNLGRFIEFNPNVQTFKQTGIARDEIVSLASFDFLLNSSGEPVATQTFSSTVWVHRDDGAMYTTRCFFSLEWNIRSQKDGSALSGVWTGTPYVFVDYWTYDFKFILCCTTPDIAYTFDIVAITTTGTTI